MTTMKRPAYIFLLLLLLVSGGINAQFAKSLPNNLPTGESQPKYNIGIFGGVSATRWFHVGGTNTVYEQPYLMIRQDSIFADLIKNSLFGLTFEYRLNGYVSLGIDAAYANRSTELNSEFWQAQPSNNDILFMRKNRINYREMFFQIPLTLYLFNESSLVRPYLFVAPRVTLPIDGTMNLDGNQTSANGNAGTYEDLATAEFNMSNMRPWNIGAVAGLGVQFKIPFGSYAVKAKLDGSCHLGLLNTYSKYERGKALDENGNVIQVVDQLTGNIINPSLLGERYIGNATVKLTLLFPIKKIQKGACVNWGEYD